MGLDNIEAIKELKGHVLSNPVRLGIMIFLISRGKVSFKTLQRLFELTPGNLGSHLKALERENYIELKKAIMDRPRTVVIVTERGIEETEKYMKQLRKVLDENFE